MGGAARVTARGLGGYAPFTRERPNAQESVRALRVLAEAKPNDAYGRVTVSPTQQPVLAVEPDWIPRSKSISLVGAEPA